MESLKVAEINLINKLGGVLEEGEKPSTEYIAAIGYVMNIRGDVDKQRVGINTHKAQFDEYMWSVDNDELTAAIQDSGLFVVELDEEDEESVAKKDTKK